MSYSLGNTIADSLQMSLNYAQRLSSDITAERFARFAAPGGQTVESNHPAFIFGHLSLYGPRIMEYLGCAEAASKPSEKFLEVFSKDAKCVDDPESTVYPAMNEVTEFFFDGYRTAIEKLRTVDDATLQQPNPMEGRMSEQFRTVGSILAFFAGGHAMMHLGQLSAWRRMEELPPA